MTKTYTSKEVCTILQIDYDVLKRVRFRYRDKFLPKHVIHQSFVEGLQWSDEGVDLVKDLIEPPKEFDPPDPAFWTENLKLRNVLGVSDTQLTYAFRKIKDNILINGRNKSKENYHP